MGRLCGILTWSIYPVLSHFDLSWSTQYNLIFSTGECPNIILFYHKWIIQICFIFFTGEPPNIISFYHKWTIQICFIFFTGEPPNIFEFPEDDKDKVYRPFTIPCNASGTPPLIWNWKKDGVDFPPPFYIPFKANKLPDGSLEFKILDRTDDGEYQCFVRNAYGETYSRKLKLKVTGKKFFYIESSVQMCMWLMFLQWCTVCGAQLHCSELRLNTERLETVLVRVFFNK